MANIGNKAVNVDALKYVKDAIDVSKAGYLEIQNGILNLYTDSTKKKKLASATIPEVGSGGSSINLSDYYTKLEIDSTKTSKKRIDFDGTSFKVNGITLNYKQLYDVHITTPDFAFVVYGDRAYLLSYVQDGSGMKELRFQSVIAVTDTSGISNVKTSGIYVTSSDGINIASTRVVDINSENSAYKATKITDSNTNDILYPSTKAVADYVSDGVERKVNTLVNALNGEFVTGSVNMIDSGTVVAMVADNMSVAETVTKTSIFVKSIIIPVEQNKFVTIEKTVGSRYYVAFAESDPSVVGVALHRKSLRNKNDGTDINYSATFETENNNYLFFSYYSSTYDTRSEEEILAGIRIFYGKEWREDGYEGVNILKRTQRLEDITKKDVPSIDAKWYDGLEFNAVTLTDTCSVSEWYGVWDSLMATYSSLISKRSLGKDQSNTYDIFEYSINEGAGNKILYVGGIHGSEKYSMRSDYLFVKYLLEHNGFDGKFEMKIIPMANPWGYAQTPNGDKLNSRGVNLNRNFPSSDWVASDVSGTKGSEAETKIIVQWLEDNRDAVLLINKHNTEPVSDGNNIAYSKSFYDTDRAIANSMYKSLNVIARGKNSWIDEYAGMVGKNIFTVKAYTNHGTLDYYATDKHSMHAYLNETAASLGDGYTSTVAKRNALLTIGMQNIANLLNYFLGNLDYALIGTKTEVDIDAKTVSGGSVTKEELSDIIVEAVNDYLTEHPVTGITPEMIASAVSDYLTQNPIEGGHTDAEIKSIIASTVTVSAERTSGTKVGSITVNGQTTNLYIANPITASDVESIVEEYAVTDQHINSLIDNKLTPLESLADEIGGIVG